MTATATRTRRPQQREVAEADEQAYRELVARLARTGERIDVREHANTVGRAERTAGEFLRDVEAARLHDRRKVARRIAAAEARRDELVKLQGAANEARERLERFDRETKSKRERLLRELGSAVDDAGRLSESIRDVRRNGEQFLERTASAGIAEEIERLEGQAAQLRRRLADLGQQALRPMPPVREQANAEDRQKTQEQLDGIGEQIRTLKQSRYEPENIAV